MTPPPSWCRRGPNKWRDMELPVQLLEDFCRFRHYPAPEWSPDKRQVIIDGNTYTLDQFGEPTRDTCYCLGSPHTC